MIPALSKKDLYAWCQVPAEELLTHPNRKIALRICKTERDMAELMARELVDEIKSHLQGDAVFRAIIPCGPNGWYEPFTRLVNTEEVPLGNLVVFHMDECLDWQGRTLPKRHPYNFRTYMEEHFYEPVQPKLRVPVENRYWLDGTNAERVADEIASKPIDLVYGGWGQDGHVAYNQACRNAYSSVSIDDLRSSTVRVQTNSQDTVIALAHRRFGAAYQFVPPMSVTLGMKELLSAKKIRLFSDTGPWKQTALRVALFGPITAEYPMTLLQGHVDVVLTATKATARHPISEHPEWDVII